MHNKYTLHKIAIRFIGTLNYNTFWLFLTRTLKNNKIVVKRINRLCAQSRQPIRFTALSIIQIYSLITLHANKFIRLGAGIISRPQPLN